MFAAPLCAQDLDVRWYESMHVHRNQSLDKPFDRLTNTTYPLAAAVPATQLVYGLIRHDDRSLRLAAQSAAALVLNAGVVYSLKYAIDRKRPFEDHPNYQPYEADNTPSMPSGHAAFAFTTATTLTLQYKKWYVAAPAYVWATGVAYSRVHLGEHYPSDVLAGAAVGAGAAAATYYLNQWLNGKRWSGAKNKKTIEQTP